LTASILGIPVNIIAHFFVKGTWVSQPHFEGSVRSLLTLPKM
jgi:hypothetical protein